MIYRFVQLTTICYQLDNFHDIYDCIRGDDYRGVSASSEIVQRVNEFTNKMDLKRPITVWETDKKNGSAAVGSNLPGYPAHIILEKGVDNFVIAHEIIHIRENHYAKEFVGKIIPFAGLILAKTPLGICLNVAGIFAAHRIIRSHFEKEADELSAPYLTVNELAKASFSYYDRSNNTKLLIDRLIFFDTHLRDIDRGTLFEEELFKRSEVLPLEVEIIESPESEIVRVVYSDESNRELRKRIRASIKGEKWVDLSKIQFKPYQESGRVELYQIGSVKLEQFDVPDSDVENFDVNKVIEWKIAKVTSDLEDTYRWLREQT